MLFLSNNYEKIAIPIMLMLKTRRFSDLNNFNTRIQFYIPKMSNTFILIQSKPD